MEDKGEIDLFFFDEAGFSLQPVVPYAWQRIGQTQIIAATYVFRPCCATHSGLIVPVLLGVG
jgi:hypothetical protein